MIGYLRDYSCEEEPVTVLISLIIIDKSELDQALGDGGGGDHLQHQPIRGQYSGHVTSIDQSEGGKGSEGHKQETGDHCVILSGK